LSGRLQQQETPQRRRQFQRRTPQHRFLGVRPRAARLIRQHFPTTAAQLLIEVDSNHEEALTEEITAIAEVVEQHHAADILLAEDRQKVDEVWSLRRGIGEAVKSISAYKEEDTVVPRAHLPQLVKGVEICGRYGLTSICYGHAGDGNVHVNILKHTLDEEIWNRVIDPAIREIFALTVKLGGTITAEHGIGYTQRPYLPLALHPVELRLMKEVKRLFDPAGILNPGKIFLDEVIDPVAGR
jgi:glycolate oxidase